MKLIHMEGNQYQLIINGKSFEGTPEQLTFLFDLDSSEVKTAILDMLANGSSIAHFGVAGTFLFSERLAA